MNPSSQDIGTRYVSDLESQSSHSLSQSKDSRHDDYQLDGLCDEYALDAVELSRINTYRLQQRNTVGSTRGPIPPEQWLSMGAGKAYPKHLPDPDEYVVEFDGPDDPMHPSNWPLSTK
jgi:DHA1 family multidrug resistance protein-like MFS transporter